MKCKKRNPNIEFLRFLFCWIVVFYHANFQKIPFGGGYLGVEFFFILSGVYLGKKLKNESRYKESLGDSLTNSWKYLWKRIKNIYPFYILSCAVGMLLYVAGLLVRIYNNSASILYLPRIMDFLCFH